MPSLNHIQETILRLNDHKSWISAVRRAMVAFMISALDADTGDLSQGFLNQNCSTCFCSLVSDFRTIYSRHLR